MSLGIVLQNRRPFLWYGFSVIPIMVSFMMFLHSSYYDLGDKNIVTTIPTGNMVILVDKPTFEFHFDKLMPTIIIIHHWHYSISDTRATQEGTKLKVSLSLNN